MTDEEKKSIEIIKFLQYKCIQENGTGMMHIYRIDDLANAIKILLNLIEKHSKEIEELKEDLKKKPMFLIKDIYSPKIKEINLQDIEGLIEQGREEVKDKIKAKIEEVSNGTFDAKIVLQSLLEKE